MTTTYVEKNNWGGQNVYEEKAYVPLSKQSITATYETIRNTAHAANSGAQGNNNVGSTSDTLVCTCSCFLAFASIIAIIVIVFRYLQKAMPLEWVVLPGVILVCLVSVMLFQFFCRNYCCGSKSSGYEYV